MIRRIKGKIEDWQGNRGTIVADPDQLDAGGRPFGDSWFFVRKYNMDPDPDGIPVVLKEEVAFLWGHENEKMIAFDVLRLRWIAPHVFLAHSSKDKPFVRDLADQLKGAKISVWLDEWEIRVGDSIVEKINQGLKASDFLVVVVSKASVSSSWVARELNSSLMRQLGDRSITILPVLKELCEVPALLSDIYYADCSVSFDKGVTDLVNSIKARRYDL
jgi:TIR domain